MNPLDVVHERLSEYPGVTLERGPASVSVAPQSPEGFRVTLLTDGKTFEVAFESWHEDFDTAEEALSCFGFGLSDACRLKVASRGGFDYQWVLEVQADDRWVEESRTGLFFFPFWRRKRVRYLQNRILSAEPWTRNW